MVLAVIQARTSSTRFPRKVLADLHGLPMLARQIERVLRCGLIDKLVVVTSTNVEDDEICEVATLAGADFWRGPLADVQMRILGAAEFYKADHVVRLTGDCPLADPNIIDDCIHLHLEDNADYTSNVEPLCYPDGLDVEVIRVSALREAAELAKASHEHVTTLLRHWPRWKKSSLTCHPDMSKIRWTVDYPKDLEKVRAIYAALYDKNREFGWADILNWEAKHGKVYAV